MAVAAVASFLAVLLLLLLLDCLLVLCLDLRSRCPGPDKGSSRGPSVACPILACLGKLCSHQQCAPFCADGTEIQGNVPEVDLA